MSNIDYLRLDGHLLKCFLIILEEGSVSKAADRMDVSQSAVSHSLSRLRKLLGDPLFIRAGQGIMPTEKAITLKEPVQKALDSLKALVDERPFIPEQEAMSFVIAANDMQRDMVFPQLLRETREEGIQLSLELKPSGVPSVSMLREASCDMMITPIPPDAPDLIQSRLFSGYMKCFYDAEQIGAPKDLEAYMQADHISVHFALGGSSSDVLHSAELPGIPKPVITVSNFAGLGSYMRGSQLIATQIEQMHQSHLKEFTMADLPFASEKINVYMVWHMRSQNDPAHKWLRERIKMITQQANVDGNF